MIIKMEIKATKKDIYLVFLYLNIKKMFDFLSIDTFAALNSIHRSRCHWSNVFSCSNSFFFSCRVFIQSSFKRSLNAFASAVCVLFLCALDRNMSIFKIAMPSFVVRLFLRCALSLFLFSVICPSTFCRFNEVAAQWHLLYNRIICTMFKISPFSGHQTSKWDADWKVNAKEFYSIKTIFRYVDFKSQSNETNGFSFSRHLELYVLVHCGIVCFVPIPNGMSLFMCVQSIPFRKIKLYTAPLFEQNWTKSDP